MQKIGKSYLWEKRKLDDEWLGEREGEGGVEVKGKPGSVQTWQ